VSLAPGTRLGPHARPTRRRFLLGTAAGLGAAAILPGSERLFGAAAPASEEGPVRAAISAGTITLGNERIEGLWDFSREGLRFLRVREPRSGRALESPGGVFAVSLAEYSKTVLDHPMYDASRMRLLGEPRIEEILPRPGASRLSERLSGRRVRADLVSEDGRLRATWTAVLREGSHYLRQEVALRAEKTDLPIDEVRLLDLRVSGAALSGNVSGSPVVAGEWFFGFEHPLSESAVGNGRVRASLFRQVPLASGREAAFSSVIGTARGQGMRRSFLEYVERERAHPYRPFLHYNSWYDIGYFSPFDEGAALDAIEAFGRELTERRGVKLDSFLFDDGWDDHRSLWSFNAGFPRGFRRLAEAAAKFGAAPGVWLSPWGGYGKPREERLAYGRQQGFETNKDGFALSGPKYFARFREVCLEFVRAGVNQFKIDGTGSAANVSPGSPFGSDFEAAIQLIDDLRAEKPDLYVNLTTGTYPSPFWLRYADSIWRGGEDHSFAGAGSDRQKWITYRDADTFQRVAECGPLFPMNSLMLHGIIRARHARDLDTDPAGDFRSEVRSYFGSGTQLQEMYVTHSLLADSDWNDLAEAALWSRSNGRILRDTHWLGGDPARLEAYGWAAWSPGGAILTLRNPSASDQSIEIDPAEAFELPAAASALFRLRSPWKDDSGRPAITVEAGKRSPLRLGPFEVAVLQAERPSPDVAPR